MAGAPRLHTPGRRFPIRDQIFDPAAQCMRQQLVPEADSEHRPVRINGVAKKGAHGRNPGQVVIDPVLGTGDHPTIAGCRIIRYPTLRNRPEFKGDLVPLGLEQGFHHARVLAESADDPGVHPARPENSNPHGTSRQQAIGATPSEVVRSAPTRAENAKRSGAPACPARHSVSGPALDGNAGGISGSAG